MSESQKEDLIRQYLPLVRKVLRQLSRKMDHRSDRIELFENGILGLVRALETYSYEDGLPFPRYAEHFIREYMTQGVGSLTPAAVELLPFNQFEDAPVETEEPEDGSPAHSGKAHDTLDFETSDPLSCMLQDESSRLIEIALNRIPHPEKQIIKMTFYENLPIAQIGRRLHISEKEVSELRSSGLRRLRKHLLMQH